jgi:hypothetical protein
VLYAKRVYMGKPSQIVVDIEEVDSSGQPPVAIMRIVTPAGTADRLAAVWFRGGTPHVRDAHVGGLRPGACGHAGLNAIGRKLLEVADVEQIIIQGAARTTGCNPGWLPSLIRFPNSKTYAGCT